MKIFAIHDVAGAISEIITTPDDAPPAGIVTAAGALVSQIEAPKGFNVADSAESNVRDLAALAEQYRVVAEPRTAKLERQPAK